MRLCGRTFPTRMAEPRFPTAYRQQIGAEINMTPALFCFVRGMKSHRQREERRAEDNWISLHLFSHELWERKKTHPKVIKPQNSGTVLLLQTLGSRGAEQSRVVNTVNTYVQFSGGWRDQKALAAFCFSPLRRRSQSESFSWRAIRKHNIMHTRASNICVTY